MMDLAELLEGDAPREVEVKFLEIDIADIRKRLAQARARYVSTVHIEDVRYFSLHEGIRGQARLRRKRFWNGEIAELAVKRVHRTGGMKVAWENNMIYEGSYEDALRMLRFLQWKERPNGNLDKVRESYLLSVSPRRNVQVEIDTLDLGVPPFLELEGTSQRGLRTGARMLGLRWGDRLPWSTKDVVRYYC